MKKYTILLALIALMGSCKKKDDDNTPPNSGASTLTSGTWKLSASASDVEYPAPVGTQHVDLYAMLQNCEKDNTFKFNTDNSITVDEGATKCDPSDPQSETDGTWTLSNNDTKFTQVYQGTTISGDVLTLNNSTLTIKYVTTFGGINSTTTTSYTRP